MRTIRPPTPTSTPRPGRARRRRRTLLVVGAAAGAVVLTGISGPAVASRHHHHHHRAFTQTNLVSDRPGLAGLTDAHVKNPWGIAFGPTTSPTPLWSSNQADNTSTLYTGKNRHNVVAVPPPPNGPLVVKATSPTGIVFNPTSSFVVTQNNVTAPARFIFEETVFTPDGDATTSITAWHNGTSTVPGSAPKAHAFYSGLALVDDAPSGPMLLAANQAPGGNIDVYDGKFKPVTPDPAHAFVDPKVDLTKTPPYNVAYLQHRVYVAYAPFFPGAPGASKISVFRADGTFIKRLVTRHRLNGPWGMAIAPEHWGGFGNSLLVGNVFNGKIHAYNRHNGHLRGTIRQRNGKPLVNNGLWGIAFGNGLIGNPRDLVFAAGIGLSPHSQKRVYEHGLIGIIKPKKVHH